MNGQRQHATERNTCDGGGWLDGPAIEPLRLDPSGGTADLIDHVFARSGFNARRLAEGAQLYARMLDADATVCLTVAGAMTPIGMSGVFISLIEHGFVDFIISTGANVFHDLARPFDFPLVQGTPDVDDNVLNEDGVARIYDVFISNDDTLTASDRIVHDALDRIEGDEPFSTATLHKHLGDVVLETAPHPEKSFVAAAARYDVPIYTSSPGDSAIGMNLAIPQLLGRTVALNPMLDVLETAAIVRDADCNGVVEIGGGSPKNFYLQTQPMLHQMLLDKSKGGHDYCLQLTTDSPHWGGLSGATFSEAKSWGKVRDAHKDNVVVYSCASITFPLIAAYVLARCKPRRPRRLFCRLDEMMTVLRDTARRNADLKAEHPELFAEVQGVRP
ncbi:MAG: deoxyhypusine synthase [Planctomycetota bacterium]|nr:MAG: deoxyhypusine synthase [Planctomycetota bacterium]